MLYVLLYTVHLHIDNSIILIKMWQSTDKSQKKNKADKHMKLLCPVIKKAQIKKLHWSALFYPLN